MIAVLLCRDYVASIRISSTSGDQSGLLRHQIREQLTAPAAIFREGIHEEGEGQGDSLSS